MHTQADALFSMEKKFGCGDSPRIRGGLSSNKCNNFLKVLVILKNDPDLNSKQYFQYT